MLAAALAGFSSLLSFEPFAWWPVGILALAWLFYQVGMDTSARRSLLVGWGFGFGWSVAGMHWLYVAITVHGGMPAPVAALAIALLAVYMGMFSALATGAATWLRRRWSLPVPAFLLLVLPACWGLSEWTRGWLFTGFPWASSGYAHNISPLAGYAPIVGVFGIGVLVAVCAACLVMLTQRARLPALGMLAAIMAAGFGLTYVDWTRPNGAPITVRLLQGDVAQDEKFSPAHIDRALTLYDGMIRAAPADLIATPETAIVLFPQQLPPGYLDGLAAFSRDTGSHLIYGIPLADSPTQYANSVAGVAPDGRTYRYDKQHLVPFGEFVPAGFRWFVDLMSIPLGDFTRGAKVQAPFAVKDQMVLPNVCYEDAFGEEIALQLRSSPTPATMLLNVSNLAWYGKSVAIPQHLQISQMRSLETGRPMLRSTNNGATAVIDAKGRVSASLPTHSRGTLSATVQGMQGATPYIRFGNALFLAWCALAAGAAWLMGRKYRQTRSQAA
ncbi:apolipoprotein N-acyltransferase [Massilia sp. R798]|uniref:Apolipoprotein N-acyltransferase n=2 Tax=Massilia soli TaxID=2792854 RepID=A0ABS7SPV6_9BURK|nr:apolipoprotein N-acyltransferase [Massilia soli]